MNRSNDAAAEQQGDMRRRRHKQQQQQQQIEAQLDDVSPVPQTDSSNIAPGKCVDSSLDANKTPFTTSALLPLNTLSSAFGWSFQWPCGWTQVQGLTNAIGGCLSA